MTRICTWMNSLEKSSSPMTVNHQNWT